MNVSFKFQNVHIQKNHNKKVTPKPPKPSGNFHPPSFSPTHLPSISNFEASKAANNAISSPSSGMLPSRQEAAKAA